MWKTHFELTISLLIGHGTITHVPTLSRVVSLWFIASFQQGQSEQDCAFANDLGTTSASKIAAAITSS